LRTCAETGVKFADETAPSEAEIRHEFAVVKKQLASLDFRERVGVFRTAHRHVDAATGHTVFVAKGEDVVDIQPSGKGKPGKVSATLRGGHVVPDVAIESLSDPDGKSWRVGADGSFVDQRSLARRLDHMLKGQSWWQPMCQSAILVVNPHQDVPQEVWEEWGEEFDAAGFGEVPVVSTHSDVASLFGPRSGEFVLKARGNLTRVQEGLDREGRQRFMLVENYREDEPVQKVASAPTRPHIRGPPSH